MVICTSLLSKQAGLVRVMTNCCNFEHKYWRFNFENASQYLSIVSKASINTLVSPLGGILSATILDQLGRKLTLVIINVLSIVSWGLIYFSSKTDFDSMFWSVMLGRFLIGKRARVVHFDIFKHSETFLIRFNNRTKQLSCSRCEK